MSTDEIIDNIEEEELQLGVTPYDEYLDKIKEDARKLSKKLREKNNKYTPVIITEDGIAKDANDLTLDEQQNEIIRCALDPIYFIETYLTVFDMTQGEDGEIVAFKLFDFQKDLIKAYQENRFNIANKYRQAGISTTTCAYLAWYISFNSNRSVAIVANKLETAQNELMGDVVEFIDSCPDFLVPNTSSKDTQKLKRYTNGCSLGAFSAAMGLRGYTPTLLFWDEVAWTDKGDSFWEAAGPTLSTGGGAIFVSTPNGMDATFYKYFRGARETDPDKRNKFNAIELWWFNDPRYIVHEKTKEIDLEWVKNQSRDDEVRMKDENWSKEHRIKLMNDGWSATSSWYRTQVANANGDMKKIAQEILCSFAGSGDNFIDEEYRKRIKDHEVKPPIAMEYIDKCMWIFEEVDELEEYIQAIDVSSGHGEDFSTINILKINPIIKEKIIKKHGRKKKVKIRTHNIEQVAEYYGKISPQELAEVAFIYGKKYNNAYTVVDVTGGRGAQTVEKLFELGYEESDMHYSEISHKPTRDSLSGYIKTTKKTLPDGSTSKVDLVPGFFISSNRGVILHEFERSVRLGELIIRSNRLYGELETFVSVNGTRVADHKRSYHDDSIMGCSIGVYVTNYDLRKYTIDPNTTKKFLDSMMKISSNEELVEVKNKNINAKSETKTKKQYKVQRKNPYGNNAWIFNGLKR